MARQVPGERQRAGAADGRRRGRPAPRGVGGRPSVARPGKITRSSHSSSSHAVAADGSRSAAGARARRRSPGQTIDAARRGPAGSGGAPSPTSAIAIAIDGGPSRAAAGGDGIDEQSVPGRSSWWIGSRRPVRSSDFGASWLGGSLRSARGPDPTADCPWGRCARAMNPDSAVGLGGADTLRVARDCSATSAGLCPTGETAMTTAMPELRYDEGLANTIAAESRMSFIDGEKGVLEYVGIDIDALARNSTFEETVYLLWHGRLPTRRRAGRVLRGDPRRVRASRAAGRD